MYSLSTCWNSHRHTDGRAMLREIRDLGMEYAELSHGIRISLLPGIIDAVDAGEIKISSLHNYCPLPMGVNHAAPNIFQFAATDRRERENAFRYSIKTIEMAARVKAKVVVLHVGRIDMKDFTDDMLEMIEKGQRDSDKFAKICNNMIEKRERKRSECLDLAAEMIGKLVGKAEELGLRLGIENREALEELPVESDFTLLMHQFNRPGVGYWHDTGHAQIKENLGFLHHAMFLQSMADRLIGFHIHDVEFPGRDHRAPGSGVVKFEELKPVVKPEHVKVFELSPSLPVEKVQEGINHIYKVWGKE